MSRLTPAATAATTPSFEVIVVDGGSDDGTPELARRHGATVIHRTRGRAHQLNAGAQVARGTFLYFLHADTLPPADWLDVLTAADPALPHCFTLSFDGPKNRWLGLFGRLSSLNVDAFRYGDQSLFVSKKDFAAVGGYDESLTLFEDYDLCKRLRRRCGGLSILPQRVVTSARKYRLHGIWPTQLLFVALYVAYRVGVPQPYLVSWYKRFFRIS